MLHGMNHFSLVEIFIFLQSSKYFSRYLFLYRTSAKKKEKKKKLQNDKTRQMVQKHQ